MRQTTHYGRKPFVKTQIQAGECMKWSILWQMVDCLYSLVPVIANGFDDLQQRVEAQTQQAAAHQEKLKVGEVV